MTLIDILLQEGIFIQQIMPDDRKFPTLSDSCKFKKGKSQAIKQSRRYFEFYKIYYTQR